MTAFLTRLPILVISAHNRCNCRCAMCDIWRNTSAVTFTEAELDRQLPDMQTLGVEWVVFTGGEALMNPGLFRMARRLRELRIRVTVLTSGLLLARYASEITENIDDVIVSLDGPPEVHDRIRGVCGAFACLEKGIRALRSIAPGYSIAARCTVQQANHNRLVETALAAQTVNLNSISFLAVATGSEAFNHAFEAESSRAASLLLTAAEILELESEVDRLLSHPVRELVAETADKLARMIRYFRSRRGEVEPEAPRCNAPWISAVLEPNGDVRPCFFLPPVGNLRDATLASTLNSPRAREFRDRLDISSNPVCRRCVCSLYREVQV